MKAQISISKSILLSSALAVVTASPLAGCKPQEKTDLSVMSVPGSATATPAGTPINKQSIVISKPLTAIEMFTKQEISAAESKAVDAILMNINDFGYQEKDIKKSVQWAERNLKMLALDGFGLTTVTPILFFKNLETLTLTGNNLSQEQIELLLAGLPKLKTLSKDRGLKCDQIKYPKVRCLE